MVLEKGSCGGSEHGVPCRHFCVMCLNPNQGLGLRNSASQINVNLLIYSIYINSFTKFK